MDVGSRFRKFRKKKGYTQTQAAEMMGIKYYQLGNYETNRTEPNITLLKKMSQIYDVSVDTLIGNKVPEVEETLEPDIDWSEICGDLEKVVKKIKDKQALK